MPFDLCVYENERSGLLEPLALTRPVFSLLCGTKTLIEKISYAVGVIPSACFVRKYLKEMVSTQSKNLIVNAPDWITAKKAILFVDGTWIPPSGFKLQSRFSHVGVCDGKPVFYYCHPESLSSLPVVNDSLSLTQALKTLSIIEEKVGGLVINYLWEIVDCNASQIIEDNQISRMEKTAGGNYSGLLGSADQLFIHPESVIEPLVAFDTTKGPIIIETGARIQSFSRLEGPCFIGRNTQIFGAKIRTGTSIGPNCRIGGEIENSVILGFTNKYHEGFLGHSYLGEWVNLGAGTNSSDLRNDYGLVKVQVEGKLVDTGLNKIGVFLGDHSRTAIGVLLNTGANIGVFSNLLPDGLLPRNIPSFSSWQEGQLVPRDSWELIMQVASSVMQRRNQILLPELEKMYQSIFQFTDWQRKKFSFEKKISLNRKSA